MERRGYRSWEKKIVPEEIKMPERNRGIPAGKNGGGEGSEIR